MLSSVLLLYPEHDLFRSQPLHFLFTDHFCRPDCVILSALGFSDADANLLYLPVDPAPDAPTVEAQENNDASLLNMVRRVISLRHQEQDLQADGDFTVLCSEPEKPFVYRRGQLLLALNPSGSELFFDTDPAERQVLYSVGETAYDGMIGRLCLGPQSFVVLK